MPIDLCSSVGSVSQYAFGSSALNGILSSSIFMAIMISFIMVILIMILYPAKKGTSFFLVGKMFVYMFFISWMLVFLHDSVLNYINKEKEQSDLSHDFMHGVSHKDPVYGNYEPISPTQTIESAEPVIAIPDVIEQPTPVPVINNGRLGGSHPPISGGNPYK